MSARHTPGLHEYDDSAAIAGRAVVVVKLDWLT
jgi:hypothetical protein